MCTGVVGGHAGRKEKKKVREGDGETLTHHVNVSLWKFQI